VDFERAVVAAKRSYNRSAGNQYEMRHANTSSTMDPYSHVTPTMQKQVSDQPQAFIEGNKEAEKQVH
jgi:hypothetical protein